MRKIRRLLGGKNISQTANIGENVSIRGDAVISGRVTIGANSIINRGTIIRASAGKAQIVIGRFCSIAHNVFICTFNHNIKTPSIWGTYDKSVKFWNVFPLAGEMESEDIIIGNDVWIGTNVCIMPGVKIGNGAVIGANSVVTKDVEPYEVSVGTPNRKVKYRFRREIMSFLESLEWWLWDDEKLQNNKEFFHTNLTGLDVNQIRSIIK